MAEVTRDAAVTTAEEIRDETANNANTPERVGGHLLDVVESAVWNNKGTAVSRPASSTIDGDRYFATDTGILSIWDGSAWQEFQRAGIVTNQVLLASDIVDGSDNAEINYNLGLSVKLTLDQDINVLIVTAPNLTETQRAATSLSLLQGTGAPFTIATWAGDVAFIADEPPALSEDEGMRDILCALVDGTDNQLSFVPSFGFLS